MSEEQPLRTEVRDRLAVITLERPDRYNAINGAMMAALTAQAQQISQRDDVYAVILRAEGKNFSVGADQKSGAPVERASALARSSWA